MNYFFLVESQNIKLEIKTRLLEVVNKKAGGFKIHTDSVRTLRGQSTTARETRSCVWIKSRDGNEWKEIKNI